MKTQKVFWIANVAILALLLAGCGGTAAATPDPMLDALATGQAQNAESLAAIQSQMDGQSATDSEDSGDQTTSTGGNAPAASECPTAKDLGPWAPNNGVGEDFEVTANETVSAGVHVQLWWPAGSGQAWGTQEISVFVPSGLSIEVQDGAGKGWEYALTCSMEEIQFQMDADHARRTTDTSYYGVVDVDKLIQTGLVTVRFDRR